MAKNSKNSFNDLKTKYDLAESRRLDGDYVGALNILRPIVRNEKKPVMAYCLTAEVYMDSGYPRFALWYWYKYLECVTKAEERAFAYSGLGTAFYRLGNLSLAGYYYDKQLSCGDIFYDGRYMEYMDDFFTEIESEDEESEFFVSYPPSKMDSKRLIEAVDENIFGFGDESVSVNDLLTIPENDENYIGAQLRYISYEMQNGSEKAAFDRINNLIDDRPDDALLLVNKLILLIECATGARRKKLSDSLASDQEKLKSELQSVGEALKSCINTCADFSVAHKAACAYMDLSDYETALYYAKAARSIDPYAVEGMYICAVANYNVANYAVAEENFTEAYQLTGTYLFRYYIKRTRARLIPSRGRPKKNDYLGYEMVFPFSVARDWADEMYYYYHHPDAITEETVDRVIELCSWLFSFPNEMRASVLNPFISKKLPEMERFFVDTLLDYGLDSEVKQEILYTFLINDYSTTVSVTMDGVYFSVKLHPLVVPSSPANDAIKKAYSFAFVKIFALVQEDIKLVYDAARRVIDKLPGMDEAALKKIQHADICDLAAALIILSDGKLSVNHKFVTNIVFGSLRKADSLLKILSAPN